MYTFVEIPANKMSLSRRKLVHGVGINDAWYNISFESRRCPFYSRWKTMLNRCYSTKVHERLPRYADCTVCAEWLVFSRFREWMEKQHWWEMDLDKDLLTPGNKIYSPEHCMFVPKSLNYLLADSKSTRGDHPQGVCFDKSRNKYQSHCSVDGISKNLGRYDTSEEASLAYKKAKSEYILTKASEHTSNTRLYDALIVHASIALK